jgi:hypothetical protein
MNASFDSVPSTERVMAMIRGELTSPRRWFYRAVLLAASVGVAAILSLWTTEPGPLPLRLHIAFGALSAIGLSWIGVLTWILWRRRCPTALDRIATGWVATGACTLFLAVAVPIAVVRGDTQSVVWLAALGLSMWGIAVWMLRSAYSLRASLRAKLVELEGENARSAARRG